MNIFNRYFKWLMLICGLLTCSMFRAAFAPEALLRSLFGESLTGPLAQTVVRDWGVLIGLAGLMLIYGAFKESVRRMALLLVAGASKLTYVGLVLSMGQQYLQFQAGTGVVVDAIMVLLFAIYLISSRQQPAT